MLNSVQAIGRLGKDPEARQTNGGLAISKFSIAITEKYKGKEDTTWLNIVLFGKTAEFANKYLTKGSQVYIEGKIQIREHEGKYYTEIIGNKVLSLSKGSSKKDDVDDLDLDI